MMMMMRRRMRMRNINESNESSGESHVLLGMSWMIPEFDTAAAVNSRGAPPSNLGF